MVYTLDQAELVGAQVETAIFGMYLVLFPITMYITTKGTRSTGRSVNRILVAGGIILFLFVTAHWILDQSRLWQAFVVHQADTEGALLFYARLSEPRNVIRIIFFVAEMVVLDLLLLYRLYVIWGHNWLVVVLPALTELGTLVTGVGLCIGFAQAPPNRDLWTLTLAKWITSCFILSLATNILAVVFIAWRISSRDRAFGRAGAGAGSLSSIITITIESAGIYCLVNLATMITLLSRQTVHFTILAVASPVTGISFTLITLRVGLGKTFNRWMQGTSNSAHSMPAIQPARAPAAMHVRITHEHDVVQDAKGDGAPYDGYNAGVRFGSDDSGDMPSVLPVMHKGQDVPRGGSWA